MVLRCFSSPGSPHTPMYSVCDNHLMMAGFPHSDISGSKSVCRLPDAFRRLPRLSSPLPAQSSTVCASSLDHLTPCNLVTVYNVKTTFASNLPSDPAHYIAIDPS